MRQALPSKFKRFTGCLGNCERMIVQIFDAEPRTADSTRKSRHTGHSPVCFLFAPIKKPLGSLSNYGVELGRASQLGNHGSLPMTASLEIDRLAPRFRPAGSVAGHQFWSDLLFVHWRVPAVELRPLLPPEVTIDEFDGSAWVGLVPFHMSGVRPWWFPAVPGVSDFHETNVRTYVTCRGEPGVWFFSLEAAKSLAVRVARWRWRLRYFFAEMSISRRDSRIEYHSQRLWPPPLPGHTDVAAEIGDWLPHGGPQGECSQALWSSSWPNGICCLLSYHRHG